MLITRSWSPDYPISIHTYYEINTHIVMYRYKRAYIYLVCICTLCQEYCVAIITATEMLLLFLISPLGAPLGMPNI